MTENKFPGKDITEDDLKTKFPLAAKKDINHRTEREKNRSNKPKFFSKI